MLLSQSWACHPPPHLEGQVEVAQVVVAGGAVTQDQGVRGHREVKEGGVELHCLSIVLGSVTGQLVR